MEKTLVAFDFDHTIIEENSDLSVRQLAPGGKLPNRIKALYKDNDWTHYMGEIFKYIHAHGTRPEEIEAVMTQLPFVEGMMELFDYLSDDRFETIIVSDANSVFIDCIIKAAGLDKVVSKTYTNPAWYSENGCLHVKYYHTQDWCTLSTINLCKGHILDEHIGTGKSRGIEYTKVLYIGDGSNDLCPGLRLRNQDVLFPRIGFKLMEKLEENTHDIKAKIEPWSNAHDILEALKKGRI